MNIFGWVEDPLEVQAQLALNPNLTDQSLALEVMRSTPSDNAFLWEAVRKVRGDVFKNINQKSVGSCVGFGSDKAYRHTACVEIVSGEDEQYKDTCPEVIYGLSRVEIGKGRIRGDGSLGIWASLALTRYGNLARDVYGNLDLREYNEDTCRRLGRDGLPTDLEELAKQHGVTECLLVEDWPTAKKFLSNGFAIFVCSNTGFHMRRNDKGISLPDYNNPWAHCMAITGYYNDGKKDLVFIDNSWGDEAHTGPVGESNPPTSGFYTYEEYVDAMLGRGDSFAVSGVRGFKAPRVRNWRL